VAWYSSEKASLPFVSNLAWRKIKLIPRGFYVNCMLKGSASLSSSTFSASRRVENRGPPDPGRAHFAAKKVQSVAQRMRLECGLGFRQLRTCHRTRPGWLWATDSCTAAKQQNYEAQRRQQLITVVCRIRRADEALDSKSSALASRSEVRLQQANKSRARVRSSRRQQLSTLARSATARSSLAAFQRLPIVQPAHSLSASD